MDRDTVARTLLPFDTVTDTKRVTGYATTLSLEAGYRLAGVTDGEGCFSISRTSGKGYVCNFKVKMRSDDRPFLETIRDEVGMGSIHTGKPWTADGHKRNGWVAWTIQKKSDLLKLTEIFDTYTLRSKKRKDYEIWRQAVIDWNAHGPGDSWEFVAEAHDALREVRRFRDESCYSGS